MVHIINMWCRAVIFITVGSVLFNDPHTLGGVISVGVPKSFHQFSIKLLFGEYNIRSVVKKLLYTDASEDGQTKFKLNYLVLTQNGE